MEGTDESAIEYAKCLGACDYFIHEHVTIDEPQGEEVTELPFHLWPAQFGLLRYLLLERLIVILKARQLGISWLVCAYALWMCLFQKNRVVLMFSQGEREANELTRRCKAMFDRIREPLKGQLPALVTDNTTTLEWTNGSRLQSLPSTKTAGRSLTASLMVMDEFAFAVYAAELYAAAKPAADGGGQMIILSTANGEGNQYHQIWDAAWKRLNRFVAVFLPWWARPGRTKEWYAQIEAESIDPKIVKREYPATPEEAFVNTGSERFLDSMILWDKCKVALPDLDARTPLVLAADAGVSSDNFALSGVSRWEGNQGDEDDGRSVAVRYAEKWEPPPGGKIDFKVVRKRIEWLCDNYNVVAFVYDPYQLHEMGTALQQSGTVWTMEFPQGPKRLEADKQLLDLIMARRIAHDGNADLRDHIDNADRQVDTEGRKLRIVKRQSTKKIDLAVATSMAAHKCLELNL